MKIDSHSDLYRFLLGLYIDPNRCSIDDQFFVNVDGSVTIPAHVKEIPFKFGHIDGDFDCGVALLSSFEGIPRSVKGYFACDNRCKIESHHLPLDVGGSVYLGNQNGMSFKNFHLTHSQACYGFLQLPQYCPDIVSLAFINGIKEIAINTVALTVIHDPFLWQEKLLDMGLAAQARV
jgi:hypothetical protein